MFTTNGKKLPQIFFLHFVVFLFFALTLIAVGAKAEVLTLPRAAPLYSLEINYDAPTYSSRDEAALVACNRVNEDTPLICDVSEFAFQGPLLTPPNYKSWFFTAKYRPPPPSSNTYPFYIQEVPSKECPANSTLAGYGYCRCNSGFGEAYDNAIGQGLGFCIAYSDLEDSQAAENRSEAEDAGMCTRNPIVPAIGIKYRHELDWIDSGPAPLSFSRIYRSSWSTDTRPVSGLDSNWNHNHNFRFALSSQAISPPRYLIVGPNGNQQSFYFADSFNLAPSVGSDSLGQFGSIIRYGRSDDNSKVDFDVNFNLRVQSRTERNGWALTYGYNGSGQLTSISNSFGRSLSLGYDSAGRLNSLTTPDSRIIAYSYDNSGRLSAVTYPDGKSRTYLYENNSYPNALTGIVDESGVRWGNFSYDEQGRAIMSELAGGVERYSVSYSGSNSAVITDPLNTSRSYGYSTKGGRRVVTAGSMRSGSFGSDAVSRVQDANGLITSETDFKGSISTTTWNTTRRLPTTFVSAFGATEGRTVSVQWHDTFSLPTQVTEPGRTTAYTYDNAGNLLTRAVTDTAAFPNTTRTWSWTYNAKQLVETETAPNGAISTYTYDGFGNVLTSSNALGHITSYTYDNANRVISRTEPNGLTTTYTYDLRDRLLTQTVGGQRTTIFTYKPYGGIETVTLPTGLVLAFTYDSAHRLTGWSNNRGESGTYTLDNMGNRVGDQVANAGGAVAWSTVRTINAINRVASTTEGGSKTSAFGYDENGEQIFATDGLNQSRSYGLDALRRVKTITDAANATATLKYNALDAVTEAKDFAGVVTAYARDALGNATSEVGADIGAITTQYDNLGLPSQIVDALGQATTITRDAQGRPTGLVFADGKTTTLRYDLSVNSKGYLSEIIDRSGTTEYTRDGFGRVTLKKQTLANGSTQQVSYAYNPNGTLASIGYPNGGTLSRSYDATGRLTGLNWNGNPLVSGIAWNPLGQPTAWSWAFSSPVIAASRTYDTAARLTGTEFSSYVYDAAGRITSLTQNLWQPGDSDPTHSAIASSNITWSVGYNALERIVSFNAMGSAASDSAGFGYDANGNRSSSTRALNGQTTSRTYTVGATSNRLTGFTQTINGSSSTSVTYGYNTNGDLLTDGLRSYTYDAEGRLAASTTGATDTSPTTRYAHNALGQRVFKTEPLYPPSQGNAADPGFMQSLIAFFTKLWSPATTQAEQLGYAYTYDEQGTLIAEVGSGGTASAGQAQYIYLPTANGPMPIAAVIDGAAYAVHSDHLNTPRKLTNANGEAVWQWGYSAFGEDRPTLARSRFANLDTTPNPGTTNISEVKFNLRYPGQYADEESGLSYNYFRSYDARTGRYSQPDPIGLKGGWNRFGYVNGNPLKYSDSVGLLNIVAGGGSANALGLAGTRASAQLHIEGGGYYNFESGQSGAFSTSGIGVGEAGKEYGGVLAGAGSFLGLIKGDPSNIAGDFKNLILNIPGTAAGLTIYFGEDGTFQGVGFGAGEGVGAGVTRTNTTIFPKNSQICPAK